MEATDVSSIVQLASHVAERATTASVLAEWCAPLADMATSVSSLVKGMPKELALADDVVMILFHLLRDLESAKTIVGQVLSAGSATIAKSQAEVEHVISNIERDILQMQFALSMQVLIDTPSDNANNAPEREHSRFSVESEPEATPKPAGAADYHWYFESEGWIEFDGPTSESLETLRNSGRDELVLCCPPNNEMHTVNLETMTITNQETLHTRRLSRLAPWSWQVNRGTDDKPAFSAIADNVSAALESAFENGKDALTYRTNSTQRVVDLRTFTELDHSTGAVREVRRVSAAAATSPAHSRKTKVIDLARDAGGSVTPATPYSPHVRDLPQCPRAVFQPLADKRPPGCHSSPIDTNTADAPSNSNDTQAVIAVEDCLSDLAQVPEDQPKAPHRPAPDAHRLIRV